MSDDGNHAADTNHSPSIGAVVVARMKSSRLPGKSMVPIEGRPSLEWLLRRLLGSRYIESIVVATTTDPADDPIEELAVSLGHQCHCGSESDVLGRVRGAVEAANIDIAVHVTGDCPLIDPQLVDDVVELFLTEQVDYASLDFEAFPQGVDVEVFSAAALQQVDASFTDPWIREHVTEPLYTMPDRFRAIRLPAPREVVRPQYRICIDTPEDHALVKEIFARLLHQGEEFGTRSIVTLLDNNPELVAINAQSSQTKYSCAVIGLGGVGATYEDGPQWHHSAQTHTSAYLRYGKTHLVAGSDTDPTKRREFAKRWNIEATHHDAASLFDSHDVDIVSIATPIDTHADLCLQAVRAGVRAILCEKPFVKDIDAGRHVIEACRQNGVHLAVNHWMRFSPLYQNMRSFLQSGGLGNIQQVRCHYTKGALNSGTHAVDLIRFLVGEISSVKATQCIHLDTGDHNIGGLLKLEAGFPASLTVSDYRDSFFFELEAIGTSGKLVSTDDNITYWACDKNGPSGHDSTPSSATCPFDTDVGKPFENAVAQLVNSIETGQSMIACTGEDGLRAVEVIQVLRESWKNSGRWQDVYPLSVGERLHV